MRSDSTFKSVGQKAQVSANKNEAAMFKYIGNTGLTVVGNITKKSYRFNFPGDVQLIAQADVAGMYAVPVLRNID
ncbi:MAG: hypothetical protein QM763_09625 [Agriterribacter sp.]